MSTIVKHFDDYLKHFYDGLTQETGEDVADNRINQVCDERFHSVADAFGEVLDSMPRGGAAVAIYQDGHLVVDLWGGTSDLDRKRSWNDKTLTVTFSCTKALLATCVHAASQAGRVDLDQPIASYWPEFERNGKVDITTRMVLTHSAGLAALDEPLLLEDILHGNTVASALEVQKPLWRPGTRHAYHAMTYGWLVAEILQRATGTPLSAWFERLFGGAASRTWLGVPAAELDNVAEIAWDLDHSALDFDEDVDGVAPERRAATRAVTLGGAFEPALVGFKTGMNDPVVQSAGVPAVGAISDASSLARCWSRTIVPTEGSGPILTAETIRDATRCLAEGQDAFGNPAPWPRWGSGYMLDSRFSPMLTPGSFGHDGAGGQLTFADPENRVGFAFLTNTLRNVDDGRATSLVDALRASL